MSTYTPELGTNKRTTLIFLDGVTAPVTPISNITIVTMNLQKNNLSKVKAKEHI